MTRSSPPSKLHSVSSRDPAPVEFPRAGVGDTEGPPRELSSPGRSAGATQETDSYGPTVAKYSFARSVAVVCVKKGVNLLPMLSSPT
jgi:hypothetical protein